MPDVAYERKFDPVRTYSNGIELGFIFLVPLPSGFTLMCLSILGFYL